MTKTTLLSLVFFSLLTHNSSYLISFPSRILPLHIKGNKFINHKNRRKEYIPKEVFKDKLFLRHYTEPHERNAPNPRKRPYYTRSPSTSPSSTSTVTPACKLDNNGQFGIIKTNISTNNILIDYAYKIYVKNSLISEDIRDLISKIKMKLGNFLVASLWDECPDISVEAYKINNHNIRHVFKLKKFEEKSVEKESNTHYIKVNMNTVINDNILSNIQNYVMGLSIEPQDQLSQNVCRELKIEGTAIPMTCHRVDGKITFYTQEISPRQTIDFTNHITDILEDTLSNSHFLDIINEEIIKILSSKHDSITQPPIQLVNSLEESSKRKTKTNTTWILTSTGALGAVFIAATIKFKRQQWLTKKDSAKDDGNFSISSYGSWFRKRGGNMHVDPEGNVEAEVVV